MDKRTRSLIQEWLRKNSSVYARRSPPAQKFMVCTCGHRVLIETDFTKTGTSEVEGLPKHLVGEAWVGGQRLDKFCDGIES